MPSVHPSEHHGVTTEGKAVLFLDVDNTLYSKKTRIQDIMADYIRDYIASRLKMSEDDADRLHKTYYKDYGLAIEGLVRNNHIDAMDYNKNVDNRLPLDGILSEDIPLQNVLKKLNRNKVKVWLFTNAYITHAERVAKLLGIWDQVAGVTYCDYGEIPMICKPMPDMYEKAMREAGLPEGAHNQCFYVDDSLANIDAAQKLGWNAIQLDEDVPCTPTAINSLTDLPKVYPDFFTS